MSVSPNRAFIMACSTAVVAVIVGTASLLISQPAAATAKFGKETGKACGECHTAAKGGGPLTPFGEAFKANGNKLPQAPYRARRRRRAGHPS